MGAPPTNDLERWGRGETLDHRKLNQPVEAIRRLTAGVDRPRQRESGGRALVPKVQQFKISEIKGDYLVCNTFNGTQTGDNAIHVAKPPMLRASLTAHNAVTFAGYSPDGTSRVASKEGEDDETQIVIPAYVAEDVIYALRNIAGGVGVAVGDTDLEWLDINVDGRAWAKQSS